MNNITLGWDTFLAGIATLIAISGWIATVRKTSMAEGKHLKEIEELVKRVGEVEKENEYLRGCTEETKVAVKGLVTDMDWVKTTLGEIKAILQRVPV